MWAVCMFHPVIVKHSYISLSPIILVIYVSLHESVDQKAASLHIFSCDRLWAWGGNSSVLGPHAFQLKKWPNILALLSCHGLVLATFSTAFLTLSFVLPLILQQCLAHEHNTLPHSLMYVYLLFMPAKPSFTYFPEEFNRFNLNVNFSTTNS